MDNCMICGASYTAGDPTLPGQNFCPSCRKAAREQDARIRAAVARAHREGRIPAELRAYSSSTIDTAMDDEY